MHRFFDYLTLSLDINVLLAFGKSDEETPIELNLINNQK